MRLEQDRAGAHDFSPLTPLIARRANLIEATMGSGQRLCLRERTLTGSLSRSIHIDHQPLFFHPVKQAAGGSKREACSQILLKESPQRFHRRLIKSGKKAREGRTMGQVMTTKKRHKWFGKWQQPLIKGKPRGFARNCIADQDGDKIDHVVLAKTGACETHLFLDC